MTRVTWIITGIFLLAAAVVVYVLYQTKLTLKNAQTAADKVDTVVSDTKGLVLAGKNTWGDIKSLFGDDTQ